MFDHGGEWRSHRTEPKEKRTHVFLYIYLYKYICMYTSLYVQTPRQTATSPAHPSFEAETRAYVSHTLAAQNRLQRMFHQPLLRSPINTVFHAPLHHSPNKSVCFTHPCIPAQTAGYVSPTLTSQPKLQCRQRQSAPVG